MGYSERTFNYSERIILFDCTHVMSIADIVAIGVETNGYYVAYKPIALSSFVYIH